ncbi:PAS domain S-box/diguanylate cyclase (GGDEF) domain-containing protein [Blastococcus saxobsidens DD2]|uniref:PAS domain S-box/diguanylate cyclase (GGDEF) domain-containing protein n=1 Tax=Blastococcus saxobsidens (strain DD2) TaxID=1146883 RepID=H6RP47_BLASD|nr:PAS domain S-box/diguanylate cyclase (GGDEF) domain-containing protein [Blastococcus saxobsidens DD2]
MGGLSPADQGSAFRNAPTGMAVTTTDGVLTGVNPALSSLLGRSPAELHGRSLFDLIHPDDVAAVQETRRGLQAEPSRPARYECRLLRANGSIVPVQVITSWVEATPHGDPTHLIKVIEDITERKALEAELRHQALHDPLTDLPNRVLFGDRLRHALDRGRREHTPTCVLAIDLDDFKAVNDAHGHTVGDRVLIAFAERLRSVLRASDTAARLGGDEFMVACENTEPADAELLAGRLRTAAAEPLVLDQITVSVGLSIGIGYAAGGTDPQAAYERVIREADQAMYAEKTQRRQ